MFFKIEKGSKVFTEFKKILKKMHSANTEALKLVKEFNGTEKCSYMPTRDVFTIAGGIRAIVFDENPGKGWKLLNKNQWDNIYHPDTRSKIGKEIKERFEQLPTVDSYQITELLKCEKESKVGHPGFSVYEDVILLEMNDYITYDWYTPVSGMTEITAKEYKEIVKSNEKVKKNERVS